MSEFYYYVWGLYALSALGLLILGWLMLRHFKKIPALRFALMALLIAALFTPAKLIPAQLDLTPALMVALFDGLAEGWSGAWPGVKYILLVFVLLLLVLALGYAIRALFRPAARQQQAQNPEPQKRPAQTQNGAPQ